jgi:replication factor C subunit 3/5
MLFYGPSGAGKKTRISATLNELFGSGVEKVGSSSLAHSLEIIDMIALQLKIDQRVFLTPSRRKLDVNVVQSNYHIELTPRFAPYKREGVLRKFTKFSFSEVGNYDRVVIQEILKEIAQTQQVDLSAKQRFKGPVFCSSGIFQFCLNF